MSSRHRDRDRDRDRRRSSSGSPDWRNVRVKEEPISDAEGSRHNNSRHSGHGHRDRRSRSRDRDRDYRQRERRDRGDDRGDRDRHSHQGHRDRDDVRSMRIKSEPRSKSRSPPPPRGEFARPRDRGDDRDRRRDPDRHDRSNNSRSDRQDDRPRENRDVKREKDWDNFFNPESDMSRQANVKRERSEGEREQRIEEYGPPNDDGKEEGNVEKEKPNFGLSGKLTEETNTYKGVVIKYSEPPEARKPIKTRWRLYPFKNGEALDDVMYIHRQSAYLLGRERKIADIPIDHPSCSKQHAVIQYRLVPYEKPNGSKGRRIRPYLIDLESANGTLVNGKKIEPKRYVELMEKDVLKFGFSTREYVLLHEHSKDDEIEEDELDKSPSPE